MQAHSFAHTFTYSPNCRLWLRDARRRGRSVCRVGNDVSVFNRCVAVSPWYWWRRGTPNGRALCPYACICYKKNIKKLSEAVLLSKAM